MLLLGKFFEDWAYFKLCKIGDTTEKTMSWYSQT